MGTPVNVLVVDDELGIREGCRRALAPHGFAVEVAENGVTGLRKLREGRFDVLLLDVMIPGMSGLEVLQQVRQLDPTLTSIVITGYATVEMAVQAIREGAYDFISKPFTSELLRQVINRGLERRRLQREAERVKVLEEETRELARAKAELEKLKTVKSRFMLSTIHILRAPVAVLQNSVQLIRKGYIPPEDLPDLLQRADQRAGELLSVLDDLLILAHVREGVGTARAEPIPVADLLAAVVASLQGEAHRQGVTVRVEVADEPSVTANPDHLRVLWAQLLGNAIRYTPAGGSVVASVRSDRQRGQAVLTVSDTGIGVVEEEIPRIFEEFYRSEAARAMQETGTGLGLPIVQQVAELYGGTVEVESAEGQGSTFRCLLPLSEGPEG